MSASNSHSPLETHLLLQSLARFGVEPRSFAYISQLLANSPLIRNAQSYDAARLSPAALNSAFHGLLSDGVRGGQPPGNAAQDGVGNGSQDSTREQSLSTRKLASNPTSTARDGLQDGELLRRLANRSYERYKDCIIHDIREDESTFTRLQQDIREIQAGEWDHRLAVAGQRKMDTSTTAEGLPTADSLLSNRKRSGPNAGAVAPDGGITSAKAEGPIASIVGASKTGSKRDVEPQVETMAAAERHATPGKDSGDVDQSQSESTSTANGAANAPDASSSRSDFSHPHASDITIASRINPSTPPIDETSRPSGSNLPEASESSSSIGIQDPQNVRRTNQMNDRSAGLVSDEQVRLGQNVEAPGISVEGHRGTHLLGNGAAVVWKGPRELAGDHTGKVKDVEMRSQAPTAGAPLDTAISSDLGSHAAMEASAAQNPDDPLPQDMNVLRGEQYARPTPSREPPLRDQPPSPTTNTEIIQTSLANTHLPRHNLLAEALNTPRMQSSMHFGSQASSSTATPSSQTRWKPTRANEDPIRPGSPSRPPPSPLSDVETKPQPRAGRGRKPRHVGVQHGRATSSRSPPMSLSRRGPKAVASGRKRKVKSIDTDDRSGSRGSSEETLTLRQPVDGDYDAVTIKHEQPPTPSADTVMGNHDDDDDMTADDNSVRGNSRRHSRHVSTSRSGFNPVRKGRSGSALKLESSSTDLPRPMMTIPRPTERVIMGTRNFPRTTAPLLNDITSHKFASLFAAAVKERDAPGYRDLIYQPQDLKSIKSAIAAGGRVMANHTGSLATPTETREDSPRGFATPAKDSTILLTPAPEVMPPKGIVNSAQLEKELMRMFANAIMFNPDPNRGFGPAFDDRGAGDGDVEGDVEGAAVDDYGSVAKDAGQMCNAVEEIVTNWRAVEAGAAENASEDVALLRRLSEAQQSRVESNEPATADDDGEADEHQDGGRRAKRRRAK
ncbi:MAG: hypothetical protein M1817_002527 [Caeruleum heppii]|nr:MAG: hypothetical protein M1817_002527 [Caeruleum heppii]